MNSLTVTLYCVAAELAEDLRGGLYERAADAVDAAFEQRDIRDLAIQFVVDHAREIARARVAEIERRATLPRTVAESRRLEAEEREESLQSDPATRGHVGQRKPGSASRDNPCNQCQRCRETWAWEREHERKYAAERRKIEEEYEARLKAELYVQWTDELLSAEIAMPDGSRTTWGLATIEQHQVRRDRFASNAMANMECAARHAQAIDALTTSGAPNLAVLMESAELAAQGAAA